MGPGYQMHYLANNLIKRGHKVVVYSQSSKPKDADYEVAKVNVGTKFRTFKYMIEIAKIDYSGFDVIHASGDDALLFLNKSKPPLIRTFLGSSLAEALYIKKPKEILRKLILAFFEYISILVADKCVLISKYTRRFIPFVKDIVYCGVDTDKFKPMAEKSQNPSILFVGALGWRKRGDMLVDIYKNEIQRRIPNVELWLVANETASGEGIKNFGRVSTEKLIELYQKAWVFCLPSTYEGFGVPYIEAMACGTPVVASSNLGAREVLDNGKYGIIVQDKELSNTLINLLQNQKLRKDYTLKGICRSKDFDFTEVANQYENLYENLILRRRK